MMCASRSSLIVLFDERYRQVFGAPNESVDYRERLLPTQRTLFWSWVFGLWWSLDGGLRSSRSLQLRRQRTSSQGGRPKTQDRRPRTKFRPFSVPVLPVLDSH